MLDLSLSGFGGWNDQTNNQPPPVGPDNRTVTNGLFTGGAATLLFTHPGERWNMGAFGSAFTGYFPDNKERPWYDSYAGGGHVAGGFDLGRRNHIGVAANAGARSDFGIAMLGTGPGTDIPLGGGATGFDNSLQHNPTGSANASASFTHEFTSRQSLLFGYYANYSHFFNASVFQNDTLTQAANVRYQYRLTRYAGFHVGYQRRETWIIGSGRGSQGFNDIDAGADVGYGRAYALTRTTTFAFSTGTSVASSAGAPQEGELTTNTHVVATGNASLTQMIGRSWTASIAYDRSLSYTPGFNVPWLSDNASAAIGGLIGRRLDFVASTQYRSAAIGLGPKNFDSLLSSAQLRYAIVQSLAAFAYYYYYDYNFGPLVLVPFGVPRDLQRQGVRVGLTYWLPLWASRGTP
jgi:hypothetical protein